MANNKINAKNASNQPVEMEITTPANGVLRTIYCDAVIQVGVGPFTSRLLLGTQTGDKVVTPELQVVIPTNALLVMAQYVLSSMSADSTKKQIEAAFTTFIQAMDSAKNA